MGGGCPALLLVVTRALYSDLRDKAGNADDGTVITVVHKDRERVIHPSMYRR